MKKAIYNHRHSQATRTTENAFGILSQYFRIFFTPIAIKPETVDSLVMTACILHNMLQKEHIPYSNEDTSSKEHNLHVPN
jgi:hypothetical protein